MKRAILLLTVLLYASSLYAQHEKESADRPEQDTEAENFAGMFIGNTIITQSGFKLPTIGVEYIRELGPRLGIGLSAELELGSHVVQKDEDGDVVSEVRREGAVLILPSVFYRVYGGLVLTAGYGIEFEKNENLGLMKLGVEYKFKMHNPDWLVVPQVSWDHTKLFDGVVYGVTFGYSF
ncbi:MAG: hypothetical protein KDC79_04490 [Cyclobacteriaceae bacterium]|nr:hypothetical protein [Cyclobacteriaceae bacterium]